MRAQSGSAGMQMVLHLCDRLTRRYITGVLTILYANFMFAAR